MASVHPSRMSLVPQDPKQKYSDRNRGRSPSPHRRRRSPTPPRSRSRDRSTRTTDREKPRGDGRRDRDRSRDKGHREAGGGRRASPEYDDYRRPPPPAEAQVPWRQQEKMYPSRRGGNDRDRPPHASGSYGGGGGGGGGENADFLESRRTQRENAVVNVWPPSPKAPARGLSPKRGKSSKKSKRRRSPSTSDSSSDEDRRRRERKEKKRAKKEKERDKGRDDRKERRRRSRSRSPRRSYDDDSEDERRRPSGKRSRTRSRSKSKDVRPPSPSRSPSRTSEPDEDEWVVKPLAGMPPVPLHSLDKQAASMPPPLVPVHDDDEGSDDEVGPQPIQRLNANKRIDERSYGGALLRGEGSAMAAFLQDGTESRIPRRGEIGLTSDEIAKYEDVGYVMSGSRHRRMNAVRMRKENQVISAEEKRGILKLQKEERERREAILREEFNELVNERLKSTDNRAK